MPTTSFDKIAASNKRKYGIGSDKTVDIYFDLETFIYPPYTAYAVGYAIDNGKFQYILGPDCCATFC